MNVKHLKEITSRKLALLLKNSGKTLEATAYDLNIPLSQYYRLLKGQCLPLLPTFLNISRVYGVSLDWWFQNSKPPKTVKTHKNLLEYKLLKAFKKLDAKSQKSAVGILNALAKNQN